MKPALLIIVACALFFSCKKHKTESNPYAFWTCSASNYDSATIVNKLQGSWKWTHVVGGDGKVINADKNITVTFNADATFTVKQDNAVLTSGTWKLESNSTALTLSAESPYLYGSIQFCDNQVAFIASFFDGANNYFEKIN